MRLLLLTGGVSLILLTLAAWAAWALVREACRRSYETGLATGIRIARKARP